MCNGLRFADEAESLREWTKYGENHGKVLSQLISQCTNTNKLLLKHWCI